MNGEEEASNMKKALHLALFLILSVLLLTVTAFADTGPKPRLTITVKNAPDEVYYLDLLEPDGEDDKTRLYDNLRENQESEPDAAMLQTLLDHTPEGWHACMAEGTAYAPVWGSLTSEEKNSSGNPVHIFRYSGVPETYRIITVTKSGAVQLSEPRTRLILQSSVTYDYAANTLSSPPVAPAYAVQFLSTLLPTLIIEGLLLAAFGFSWKRNWKPFLLVNLATQLLLSAVCGVSAVRNGVNFFYFFQFLPTELVILVAEALLYRHLLTGQSRSRATTYGIVANLASAAAGLFTAVPVFQWISRHF